MPPPTRSLPPPPPPLPPLLLLLLLLLLAAGGPAASGMVLSPRCEPITVEVCKDIGYNLTTKQQSVAQRSDQRDAEMTLHSFVPLIQYKCSANLKFFLCSVFTPMCDKKWPKPIGPCRPLCESVRHRCYPILKQFGFKWPSFLNCSQFPAANGEKQMCMEGSSEADDVGGHGDYDRTDLKDLEGGYGDFEKANRRDFGVVATDCSHLRNKDQYVYVNQTADCALACGADDLFTVEDKSLAEIWMGVLATLCAVSSLVTILTFLIDRSRFKYPLRPVVFMSLCYLCYSVSYFVRLAAGREAASCDRDPATGRSILIRQGLDNTNCAVVFLLQYFFSTAASAWYVILVLTWLLQAGWKWSPEAVARRSCYFHLPAWIVPVSLTVCVLIVRKVEADELFAMCNVGNGDRDTLLMFVIAPSVVFLALEIVFLFAGFVAMSRVRRHAKSDGQVTNKFDVLMGKIGLFSALYIVPTATITGCNVYEYQNSELWHLPDSPYRPSLAAFLVKVFASLAIGLTTILWICGAKTAATWRNFFVPSARRAPAAFPKTAYQVGLSQAPASPSWPKQHAAAAAATHFANGDKLRPCGAKSQPQLLQQQQQLQQQQHHLHHQQLQQQQQQHRSPDSTFL